MTELEEYRANIEALRAAGERWVLLDVDDLSRLVDRAAESQEWEANAHEAHGLCNLSLALWAQERRRSRL